MATTNHRVIYHDREADSYGRRRFTLLWDEPHGVFRPEPSNTDGQPVGYRRAQVFRARPQDHQAFLSQATIIQEGGA